MEGQMNIWINKQINKLIDRTIYMNKLIDVWRNRQMCGQIN